ncbi:single-strand binding protein [Sulfobacillus acidophilus DSM 10332]|uniref:Single-stranded DNA-binding protein n=1 Tax=Sulfobacillus acidophilus (strain ATCC 700253 / DSM 10332 / NAL) TaxID=679936 RepID=G8U005_SULAD|nr:single-strand binding protein [Sulfobacillus acidophilus DSM 10332]
MLNQVTLIGRLTRDPEVRYAQNGKAVAGFSVAVDRPVANADGKRDADFIDCVAWDKLGETVGNHLTKGRLVAVEGRLQIRSYEAQDGTKRRVTEVVCRNVQFLDAPKKAQSSESGPAPADEELPDDLPF